MNLGWTPGNDKQNYVVCISVSRDDGGKITRKQMWRLFFHYYHYYLSRIITTTTVWWNVAEMWILKKCILSISNMKKWWILITMGNIQGVYQTKYYYDSVRKSKFSFSCHLQIDKKINNVNKDPRRKTDSKFNFSQAT